MRVEVCWRDVPAYRNGRVLALCRIPDDSIVGRRCALLWAREALRERGDIQLLIGHFLNRYKHVHGRGISGFTTAVLQVLMRHSYPGNVREREQLIERAVILTRDQQPIDVAQLFFGPLAGLWHGAGAGGLTPHADGATGAAARALNTLLDESWSLTVLGEAFVDLALERASGNVAQAARLLGVSRAQIDYRLRRRRGPRGPRSVTAA